MVTAVRSNVTSTVAFHTDVTEYRVNVKEGVKSDGKAKDALWNVTEADLDKIAVTFVGIVLTKNNVIISMVPVRTDVTVAIEELIVNKFAIIIHMDHNV